jgi:hypothetical protein
MQSIEIDLYSRDHHRTIQYFLARLGTGVMAVESLHDADAGEHRRPTFLSDQDQSFHCSLPFRRVVLGLRQRSDARIEPALRVPRRADAGAGVAGRDDARERCD